MRNNLDVSNSCVRIRDDPTIIYVYIHFSRGSLFMSSLFLSHHGLLCLFHLSTEMTRLAVKWKFDYQRERRVDSGERWEAMEMGKAERESKTKQNLLQNLRSFPCHATHFKKPKIKHTSP